MENKLYENLYNPEIKAHFLEDYYDNEATRKVSFYKIKNAAEVEFDKKKDIFEMTFEEIEEILNNCEFKTQNSAKAFMSVIDSYIEWSYVNGYRLSNLPIFPTEVSLSKLAERYVAKTSSVYYTQKDLFKYYEDINNTMDIFIIQCIFEGIKGQGFDEILSLKIEDVHSDEDNYYVTLPNRENSKHQISEFLYKLMFEVNSMDYYEGNKENKIDLIPSSYLIRRGVRGKNSGSPGEKLNDMFITNKAKKFKEYFNTRFFSYMDITKSGIMHYLNELLIEKESHIVESREYEMISDRFDIGKYYNAEYDKLYVSHDYIEKIIDVNFYRKHYGEIELP